MTDESGFYDNWTVFMVTNSDYVQWLSQESGKLNPPLTHFVLMLDEVVDIVAFDELVNTLLDSKTPFVGA